MHRLGRENAVASWPVRGGPVVRARSEIERENRAPARDSRSKPIGTGLAKLASMRWQTGAIDPTDLLAVCRAGSAINHDLLLRDSRALRPPEWRPDDAGADRARDSGSREGRADRSRHQGQRGHGGRWLPVAARQPDRGRCRGRLAGAARSTTSARCGTNSPPSSAHAALGSIRDERLDRIELPEAALRRTTRGLERRTLAQQRLDPLPDFLNQPVALIDVE